MKTLLSLLAVIGLGLAVCAGAVFGLGDGATLVPAPESVAEGFVRELVTHRHRRAAGYLAPGLRDALGDEGLRQLGAAIEGRTGRPHGVEGIPGWRNPTDAEAHARVEGRRGSVRLRFRLLREAGLWKIAGLSPDPRHETLP